MEEATMSAIRQCYFHGTSTALYGDKTKVVQCWQYRDTKTYTVSARMPSGRLTWADHETLDGAIEKMRMQLDRWHQMTATPDW